MNKEEVLKRAGFTEDELIIYALQLGVVKAIEGKCSAFNKESFEYYDNLLKAFGLILRERSVSKEV